MGGGPEWTLLVACHSPRTQGRVRKAVFQHRSVLGIGGSLSSEQLLIPGCAGLCLCSPGQTVLRKIHIGQGAGAQ